MTIIKRSTTLRFYSFRAIQPDVVDLLRRHAYKSIPKALFPTIESMLKHFECYCCITKQKVSYLSLSSPSFTDVAWGFLGSLHENDLTLVKRPSKLHFGTIFARSLTSMREEIPSLNTPYWEPSNIEQGHPIWLNRRDLVDDDDIEYWSGWIIKTRKGVSHSLSIPDIWHSHGVHFSRVIYDAYKAFAEKNNTVDLTIVNAMLVYLASRPTDWPVATFQSAY